MNQLLEWRERSFTLVDVGPNKVRRRQNDNIQINLQLSQVKLAQSRKNEIKRNFMRRTGFSRAFALCSDVD